MISPKLVTGFAAACLLLCLTGCMGFSSNQKSTQAPPADFSVVVNPTSATVAKGGSTSINASVAAQGSFSGIVQLAISGAPSGLTASLSSSSVNNSGDPAISLKASSSLATGTYNLTLYAASGSLSHSTNFAVVVSNTSTNPDFSLSATPGSQSVAAGQGTTFSVSVAALNSFTGTVGLTVSGLPSGMQASFSPTSINTSGTSVLSVSTTSSVAAGTYNLTIGGTSGTLSHTTTVGLTVTANNPPPDFSISAAPGSQTVGAGNSTSFSVTIAASNGFTGTVSLTASGLPSGMSASFSPSSITTSGTAILTVGTTSSVAAGTYTLTVGGTSGTLSHSTTVSVTVSANNPPPDFSISASPGSQTITGGNSTSFTVSVAGSNGFSGTVGLVESGMPAGMLASCSPSSITGSGSCTLNISTTTSTAAGTYTLTITGTSGTLTHNTSVSVKVNAVTLQPDFSLTASPSAQNVTAGKNTTFTATIAAVNSFSGTVALAASGMPSGVSASFSPASITTSSSSTLTVTTTTAAASGTYTLTISGTSGTLSHSTSVSLVVAAPGAAMNVLMFPGSTGTTWYNNDFPTYIFNNPVVNGVTIGIEWGGSDQGPSAGSSQYDWSYPDAQMQDWIQAGKKINFVVWANADSGSTTCGPESQYGSSGTGNCAIPTYVWNALGSSNYTNCTTQFGPQQMPNYLASAFQNNYRAFMAAMIQHYKNNPNIGYIRFGLGHGGESLPVANWNDTTTACGQAYVNSWGLTIQSWESYLQTMLNYEGSLNSTVQLMVGVTPMGNPGSQVPDFAAPIAVQNNIGFGSQGLELTDVNNCPGSTADWCQLFAQYTGQVPLELQTYMQSCPDNSCTTGSLVDLVPWAVSNHATIFEIYWQDWMVAYDPNYPGYYPAYAPILQAAAGQ